MGGKSIFPVYSRLEVVFGSGSCAHLGLVGHAGSCLTCSRICQLPDFWLSGMSAPCGSMCRAVKSRSSAGSSNNIPPTRLLSRALIPGLYFPLIDCPCHCGADILQGSPAWSLIVGAWGMIIPQRHPSITVNNSQEGRQTTVGTCSRKVL